MSSRVRERRRLVGREIELARLDLRWQDACAGRPSIVVLTGEPGIGKTRLLEEFVSRWQGEQLLLGDCLPMMNGAVPYAPITEALDPLLPADGAGPAGSTLRTLLRRADADPQGTSQAELLTAIRAALVQAAARRPLLFVIEDVHWADRASLQLLSFLDRTLRRADQADAASHMMVVLTRRSDPADALPGVVDFFADLLRSPVCDELRLAGLPDGELAQLVQGGDGADSSRTRTIVARADGNPFFALELSTADGTEVPVGIAEVLSHRLSRLSPSAVEVTKAAAVVGVRCGHRLLGSVAALSEEELLGGARDAVATGVLLSDGDDYRFRHALLHEVAYRRILPGERALLHKRAATSLVASGRRPSEIAQHFRRAHDQASALHWFVRAGRESEGLGAPDEAAAAYAEALMLWADVPDAADQADMSRLDLLEIAATACDVAGQCARSTDYYGQALEIAAAETPLTRARLQVRRGYALLNLGRDKEAVAEYAAAAAALTGQPPSPDLSWVLARYACGQMRLGQTVDAVPVAQESLRIARLCEAEPEIASAVGTLATTTDILEGIVPAAPLFQEAMDRWRRLGDFDQLLLTMSNYQEGLGCSGDLEGTITLTGEAARTVAGTFHESSVRMMLLYAVAAYNAVKLGRWDEAAKLSERAIAIAEVLDQGAYGYTGLIPLLLGRGQLDEAEHRLDACTELTGVGAEGSRMYHEWRAELGVLRGRPDDVEKAVAAGLDAIENTDEDARAGRLLLLGLRSCADQADLARATGRSSDLSEALTAGQQLIARVRAIPRSPLGDETPAHVFTTAPVRAQIDAERRRLTGADDPDAWIRAAKAWDDLGRPQPAAYCLLRSAHATAAARGPKALLAERLQAAYLSATALGAGPLVQDAVALAHRARVPLPGDTSPAEDTLAADYPTLASLTNREREVLILMADGLTNAQIAQRLVISPNTVGIHVSRVLMKLGVGSRVQAAGVAHSLGLTA